MNLEANNPTKPMVVVPRAQHPVSRKSISENALKVLYRLRKAGFEAYMVGGGVRDLMLGREPKDFDIATNALPEEVKDLFRNSRIIGRRFRLVHIHFSKEIIEVATFRGAHADDDQQEGLVSPDSGMIVRDNVYGDIESDAYRRDFTINALYYAIEDFSVLDFVGALEDLKQGIIRPIGDSATRFREDPVRMLRAVRFAAKLGFRIEPDSYQAIVDNAECLRAVPPARLFDELLKLFLTGSAHEVFHLLRKTGLLDHLIPQTAATFSDPEQVYSEFVRLALVNTDTRVCDGKPVTPAFLMAVFLWPAVRETWLDLMAKGEKPPPAMQMAAEDAVRQQIECIAIPRRFSVPMRDIWSFQLRLEKRVGKRPLRMVIHPRFRAAYDFLLLRAQSGESEQVSELAQWWTDFQEAGNKDRLAMVNVKRRRKKKKSKKLT